MFDRICSIRIYTVFIAYFLYTLGTARITISYSRSLYTSLVPTLWGTCFFCVVGRRQDVFPTVILIFQSGWQRDYFQNVYLRILYFLHIHKLCIRAIGVGVGRCGFDRLWEDKHQNENNHNEHDGGETAGGIGSFKYAFPALFDLPPSGKYDKLLLFLRLSVE